MSRTAEGGLATGEAVATVGGTLAVLGSVLPWVDAGPAATLTAAPGGPITALLGIVVVLVALFRGWARIDRAVVGVLGLATLLLGANALRVLGSGADAGAASPGIGLYVALVGGAVVVVGAVVGLVSGATGGRATTPRGW